MMQPQYMAAPQAMSQAQSLMYQQQAVMGQMHNLHLSQGDQQQQQYLNNTAPAPAYTMAPHTNMWMPSMVRAPPPPCLLQHGLLYALCYTVLM